MASGWQNPITAAVGQVQVGIDPNALLPGRLDLSRLRLEAQRQLLLTGQSRFTPILVTIDGVIFDGHHAVRAAAEEGHLIDAQVVAQTLKPAADSVLALPVR